MEYILGVIILILALVIWSYLTKKKHFKEIDRLEAWKNEIMNSPVLEELSKVKQLNMTGETEVMFERWRSEWDAIITVHMPDVEELFFDAEEYVDKFRLRRSKEVQQKVSVKLKEIEATIQKILAELDDLVGSEEKNRVEIEEIKEKYRYLKKSLLAHRHTYGNAADRLEALLDEVTGILQQYETATENGNYLNARELVLLIKDKLASVEHKMEMIPDLMAEGLVSLPNQLAELKDGYLDMVNQGYPLEHLQFDKEIFQLEQELEHYKAQIDVAETEEVAKGIQDLNESVNVLYDLLEKEVLSRQYVLENKVKINEQIQILEYENDKQKAETVIVQHSYHLNENELEGQRKLEKHIQSLSKRFRLLSLKIAENASSNSVLGEEMQEIADKIQHLKDEQVIFTGKLQALRKDEMEARETLQELRRKMSETARIISKSNIPGLPEDYKAYLREAKESLADVEDKLEEKPLDMASVQIFLEKTVASVGELLEKTETLIEKMYLAEKVIQYGNRYRSKYPSVAEALRSAEEKFRDYEYEEALNTAATAIDKVEPGSLKRMNADLEHISS